LLPWSLPLSSLLFSALLLLSLRKAPAEWTLNCLRAWLIRYVSERCVEWRPSPGHFHILSNYLHDILFCVDFWNGPFRPCEGPKRLWCSKEEECKSKSSFRTFACLGVKIYLTYAQLMAWFSTSSLRSEK
jgi:hypothetical protein